MYYQINKIPDDKIKGTSENLKEITENYKITTTLFYNRITFTNFLLNTHF